MMCLFRLFSLASFLSIQLFAQDHVDISFKTLDNDDVTLASLYKEGPVLVTFWATWCEPCRHELRALQPTFEEYRGRGFKILAINQDSPRSIAKVRSYVSSQRFPYLFVVDPNGRYSQQFNVQSIPYTVLFDSEGNIVYRRTGYRPGDEKYIAEHIREMLGEEK
jgi:cytochrome c biogenesis protein CcmG, thiol:disulfide interchange protein DsbE